MNKDDISADDRNAGKEVEQWIGEEVAKEMKAAAFEFYRQITISTPVDTGRARLGWNISINAPSNYLPPSAKKGEKLPAPDIAAAWEVVSGITVADTIYITNNVPYINRLNMGWSRQAPANFVEQAMARVQAATSDQVGIERQI